MGRFKNILYVVENLQDEREAFDRAATLALRNRAKLTVVGLVRMSTLNALVGIERDSLASLEHRLVSDRAAQLRAATASLGNDKLDVSCKVLLGGGFFEIVQEVLRSDHDLVVKAAETWPGVKATATWFGSTDLHLLRKCPCPVWIVKPTGRPRYERIVAAVDTDPVGSGQDDLNRLIMDLATSFAMSEESELYVVHAWELRGDDWMAARVALSDTEIATVKKEVRSRHRVAFDHLLSRYNTHPVRMQSHLVEGRAGHVIPEQAMRHGAELIVMGTVARTGLPGLIIGNTAENILNQVDCDVLTVKPEGFVTPVVADSSRSHD